MPRTALLLTSLALLSVTSAALADDPVKSAQPPYKPGRQVDEEPVKISKPPYKPAWQIDEVKTAKPPYKRGREADEEKSTRKSSKN